MGLYFKEFYPLHGCKGKCVFSLLIEFALKTKSVYFEVHNSDDEWNLYWNYELLPNELIPVMQQNAKKGATFTEALKDENVIRELSKLSKTYSCKLDIDDITTIKEFIKKGLSEVNRRMPHGYDGHIYKIQFHNIEKEAVSSAVHHRNRLRRMCRWYLHGQFEKYQSQQAPCRDALK